ncbi:MAG: 2Fe-2S iron-sulfur cluster-binding protein [Flavobacteriaceae bacterium]
MSNDITIHVIDRDGITHTLSAPTDMNLNLMELCKASDLPVEGICGGMALCASCQCYIESSHNFPQQSEDEEAMLAEAFYVKENSRLACQIHLHSNLEGLVVRIEPEG